MVILISFIPITILRFSSHHLLKIWLNHFKLLFPTEFNELARLKPVPAFD